LPVEATKIVIPPMPRYLFSGCCPDTEHCSNRKENDYQEKLLGKIEHIRQLVKGELNRMGLKNFWVLDVVKSLAGAGSGTGTSEEAVAGMRLACAADGVHLTDTGSSRMRDAILAAERNLDRIKAMPGEKTAKIRGFYWRGFTSPVGSSERYQSQAATVGPDRRQTQRGRGGGPKRAGHHPYYKGARGRTH